MCARSVGAERAPSSRPCGVCVTPHTSARVGERDTQMSVLEFVGYLIYEVFLCVCVSVCVRVCKPVGYMCASVLCLRGWFCFGESSSLLSSLSVVDVLQRFELLLV